MSVPFSPLVDRWFTERFGTPTPAQDAGWPRIAAGEDTLIAAPTGSGKTLAAFLWSLDHLLRLAAAGALEDRTHVVYVSPLKALGNDVQKNLLAPLAELRARADAEGAVLPDVRVMVRSGDTPAHERQAMVRRPPHILITTPESLYILLTAEKSRRFLAGAETVIVDEIHAIAQDKRGAHLALSLERLDLLAGRRLQRIGLSATQRPIEEVGRLLVGAGRPAPAIVDTGHRRELDLSIELPDFTLGPMATHELWAAIYDRVVALTASHRTTIVFVNTRRLVERVAHALEERLGAGRVAAHHGSMARRIRLEAEEKLKAGEIPVVVATASLELGIDVGAVDLVVHLGSARALATLIQRVGRSGHARGAVPKGIFFPLTRDDLVQAAAAIRAVRAGELDVLAVPPGARDILAQQCVATVAAGEMTVDEMLALARRAHPYRDLDRAALEPILDMLSEGVSTRRGRKTALLHWDRVHDRLRPRRGARLAAITGGGAIPDVADYDVVEEPAGLLVGKVNEDFAVESMRGDIFLLGNKSWRIIRVEAGRMRVEDAAGAPPTIPFWMGEAPSRTRELSVAVGRLREEVAADPARAPAWLERDCGLSAEGAAQLATYVAEAQAALGAVASPSTVIAERFFDEAGGQQLVIHAPFGGRINRAWGLALRKRFCVSFDFELQAAATDDGVLLSLGQQHSFPLESVFEFLRPETLRDDLAQAALASPMFTNRWRWNATRSLALLRHQGGKKVPMPIQRMRAEDLLAAVFPEQLGCQDNRGAGPIEIPDHPLVAETMDNCLTEAMDVDGLEAVLAAIRRGEISTRAIDTVAPSPMTHEILNSNPYTYLDDAPLEERRARAVSLRQTMPDLAGGLGALDPEAIAEVERQAWPVARDPDELHDVLQTMGLLPRPDVEHAGWIELARRLIGDGRATWAVGLGQPALVATERMGLVRLAFGPVRFEPAVQEPLFARRSERTEEEALRAIAGGWLEAVGPVTVGSLAERLGVAGSRIEIGFGQLEQQGVAMRGRYRPGTSEEEWCDRALLARIHRLTLGRLRREIEPVTAADFMRFLFRWQHVHTGTQLHGRQGLLEVVGQLQGVELPARAWEAQIFPARIARYDPDDLEHLCLAGAVAWGRLRTDLPGDDDEPAPRRARTPNRAAPLAFVLREDLPWLLAPPADAGDLAGDAQVVHDLLVRNGASFVADIARGAGLLPAAVEEALWTLVAHGLVTGDGIAGLRALIEKPEESRRTRRLHMLRGGRGRLVPAGRWALLRAGVEGAPESDPLRFARQWLRRYGVVMRELLAREARMPPWWQLVRALRTLEARGEVRGGRFVAGMVGEQFALSEAVEALRAVRRRGGEGETVLVAAADPLNLSGILVPGPRVAPATRDVIAFRDGAVVEVGELGAVRSRLGQRTARA
ncbi:MAG TPA: DEAD/DEAH box helicase [Candidatus Eisenbacteria bacterium]|nr:DEAD/DEAH box helicase [Candidatus Eisenbacteria bacterium]